MKRFLLGLLVLGSATSLIGCGVDYDQTGEVFEYETVEGNDTLVVGLECDYAPFNWAQTYSTEYTLPISGSNMFADGYDVQISRYLGTELGMNIEIKMTPWDNLILELENGTIDVIIAGMSPTEERKEFVDFTDAYYTSEFVVVTHENNKYANATSFSELNGAKGIGQAETLYDDLVANLANDVYGDFNITRATPADTVPLIALGLVSTYDFTIIELPVAQALLSSNDSLVILDIAGDNPFNVSLEDRTVSIATAIDSDLTERINTALAKLSTDRRNDAMTAAVARSA
ncbi:MAG: transporter substrate-binding domain-containing protein [bacterium]